MKSVAYSLSSFVALSLLVVACSSASGPSLDPEQSDCNTVCTKVHDCVDKNSDEDKCKSDCKTKADSDTAYKNQVSTCAACVEPRECSDTATCSGDCLKILFK